MPKISVVMPVYNVAAYITESLNSILTQTFPDFEFIIINDCSQDQTIPIIKKIQQTDPRIVVIDNDRRRGVAACLNQGLVAAQGKYVARMDGDDISLPERLEKQFYFMEQNPQFDICGANADLIDTKNIAFGNWHFPVDSDVIKSDLFFKPALLHPAVFFRKSSLDTHQLLYNELFLSSEDFEFWCRCKHHLLFANLPERLILYRRHSAQNSISKMSSQYTSVVHLRNLWELGLQPSSDEIKIHMALSGMTDDSKVFDSKAVVSWINKILAGNNKCKVYPEMPFRNMLHAVREKKEFAQGEQ
jgi:glycosyltransferase involved in cell wall biosynthesis